MGKFGSFGKTIAFSLLIIFFGYKRGRLFRCFYFAAQQVGDHQRGRNRLKHRGCGGKAANPEPRICPYCGVVAKGEETQCLSCGGTLPPSPAGANVVSNSEDGPDQITGDVRGGNNLFVSQTEVIRGGQQTVVKRVVKY